MSRVRYKHRRESHGELLNSSAVGALVSRKAGEVAARAGRGYTASTRMGKTRYRAIVYPDTWRAKIDNARHNTLVKALGGG